MKTDTELKQLLARMLPERVKWDGAMDQSIELRWRDRWPDSNSVKDTELLHVCNLIEEGLSNDDKCAYIDELYQTIRRIENAHFGENPEKRFDLNHFGRFNVAHATWQLRTEPLAKVKGLV